MESNCRVYLLILATIFSLVVGSAQNSVQFRNDAPWKDFSFNFQDSFQDSLAMWPERVLLQVANKQVDTKTPVFFKAYISSENQLNRNGKSGVLNVELLDEEGVLLKQQAHKIVNGEVQGQLNLPGKIVSGMYTVKAFTRWSQNYGSDFMAWSQIQVGEVNDEHKLNGGSEVSIIPEGGTLINGFRNRIVLKVLKNQSFENTQEGRIVNKDNQVVSKVSFYAAGLGTAIFEPYEGEKYQLELEDGSLYPIPNAGTEGYLLHVNNLAKEFAKIRVTASGQVLGQEVTLIGESGGIKYFEKKLNFSKKSMLDVELSKANFPPGVFTLKLMDNLGSEIAKRPIWIASNELQVDIEQIGVDIETDSKTYKIKVKDLDDTPVKTRLAISVNQLNPDSKENSSKDIVEQTDLFELTHISNSSNTSSYRKQAFIKDLELLLSATEEESLALSRIKNDGLRFSFQKGLEIIGHTYDLNNTLLSNTKIQLVATSEKDVWVGEAWTDAQGVIKLKDIHIEGKATLVARTKGKDLKSRLVKIVPFNMVEKEKNVLVPNMEIRQEKKVNDQTMVAKPFNRDESEKTIELEEVEVVEKGIAQKKQSPSLYGIDVPPNRVNFQDFDKPKSLFQLLAELPGVVVGGAETLNPYARILGGTGPILWVLDGFPLSQEGAATHMGTSSSSPLLEIMALANDRDIERIELLKGPEASIYGSRGSGGVFMIYTRKGNELEHVPRKDSQLTFDGYEPVFDFREFKKGLPKRKKDKMNLLYWNPNVETDENGEVIVKLVVPENASSIKIEASAISADGKIGGSSDVF
ncbi:TonB-dependent receptor [Flagellimonas okinawensis]|uniref:TonB-dependent receptor plug domain-containing protein n=1 Tax=Flagellimonas okinawensis TaxID=3031324 RepID=A0ABT5XJU5_9FLAO|nr:TonB-dependent receptor plug domain-containing protein [[Muricauda] okinawensis]MDF0705926.1 TonB-dependent receptor plug domain-containing protein [[Muricauda] okinawensis]